MVQKRMSVSGFNYLMFHRNCFLNSPEYAKLLAENSMILFVRCYGFLRSSGAKIITKTLSDSQPFKLRIISYNRVHGILHDFGNIPNAGLGFLCELPIL